jgi:DNA (cytosine-5)-methyltransferase 1
MPPKDKWLPAGELVGDGFSVAYRTIDAQHFGVPQRRRRCYLIADFASERAGEVLFERESVQWNPAAGGGEGQGASGDAENGASAASNKIPIGGGRPLAFEPGAISRLGGHVWSDFIGTLRAHPGDNQMAVAIPIDMRNAVRNSAGGDNCGFGVGEDGEPSFTVTSDYSHAVAIENHPNDSRVKISKDGIVQTLDARMGMGGGNVPLVMNERQYALTVGEDLANTLTGTDFKGTQCVFEPQTPKTLKIRSGCEGGGKGALVQDDKSATLGCNNDQTLFVPTAATFMGGQSADAGSIAYSEKITPTLRSQAGGNSVPMVMTAFGICSQNSNSMKSDNPHSGIYEMDAARTLDTTFGASGNGGTCVVFDGKQVTSKTNRSNPQPGAPCHALASGNADGAVLCMEGNGMRPSHKGSGVKEDIAFTVNTKERDCVAYALDRAAYNQGQNAQFDIGISEEQAQTVLAKGPGAVCYQDTVGALCASDHKAVQNQQAECDKYIVEPDYIVRRLVPLECSRLQGFPDFWAAGLETPNPTDAEIDWWAEVFETHRIIMGTSNKPKSRKQIVKWLKNPYSDAAEYKMWGNGCALPCCVFALAGIAMLADCV